jgi:hypothetical protein
MKNFAKINSENIVESVIVAVPSLIDEIEGIYVEVTEETGWAGPGSLYSKEKNKFIISRPFDSWTLDEESFEWTPPKEKPASGKWAWSEQEQDWLEVS